MALSAFRYISVNQLLSYGAVRAVISDMFISSSGSGFESRTCQIGHNVANVCVAQVLNHGDEPGHSLRASA